MKHPTWRQFLWFLAAVPKCAACGRLLSFEEVSAGYAGSDCLCPACRSVWEQEKLLPCPRCGEPALDCRCMPALLREQGIEALVGLGFYRPGRRDSSLCRIILRLKRKALRRTTAFVAAQLAPGVRRSCDELGVPPERLLVTFLPRRREAKNEYGHDQAEQLAVELAHCLGAEIAPLFHRLSGGKAQKTLDAAARRTNIRSAIVLDRRAVPAGRSCLIVDDIVTSGASMAYGAELLREAGAAHVFGAVIGRTQGKKWRGVCKPKEKAEK